MTHKIKWLIFIFSCLILQLQALDIPEKHEKDQSSTRRLVLDNGLKVLLVSDPDFNVSAASLDVAVGALSDPAPREGLAHFLEHMLFLGTKKYPDVDEYSRYLKSRGGYSNAFTTSDHTNYHFQVYHDAFDGALDRFSQFFIAPLFNPEFTKKEVEAVHSEHQKNLEDDMRRKYHLISTFYRKNHPENHFATGSMETLKGVDGAELKEFYDLHYSANRMSLALLSRQSLDWMEAKVREYFTPIKNKKLEPIVFDSDFLPSLKKLRLIRMKSLMELRELVIEFPLPGFRKYYESKPLQLMGFCIGHEGKGSLLSLLKKKNLATGLAAGGYDSTAYYGMFHINISLTEKGLQNYREVMKDCFDYLHMLRKEGLKDHIFREEQTMIRLEEVFSDKGEGVHRATMLSTQLNQYPLEDADRIQYILKDKNPELFKKFLDQLTPDNMLVTLLSQNQKTDKVEPIYGTEYSYEELDDEAYQSLFAPVENPELHLPDANPFIPEDAMTKDLRPVKISQEPGLDIWYLQDLEFKRPKVRLMFKVLLPANKVSLQHQVMMNFYSACLREQLNELSYPAREAGLNYEIGGDMEGVYIDISGYSDSSLVFIKTLSEHLKNITINEERFSAVKDGLLRELKNHSRQKAYQIAIDITRRLRRKVYFSPLQLQEPSEKVELKDVQTFARQLYTHTLLQGLVHGNMSADDAMNAANVLKAALGKTNIQRTAVFKQAYLDGAGHQNIVHEERLETNNSCFRRDYLLGLNQPRDRMMTMIINNFINQPFYTEMRTRQQLGYIVWAGGIGDEVYRYLTFIIQSESHSADILSERAQAFLEKIPEKFAQLDEPGFERLKQAVEKKLLEKPKSISERAASLYNLTFTEKLDFDRTSQNMKALNALSKDEVLLTLKTCLDAKTRKMTEVLLYAKEHSPREKRELLIKDFEALKKSANYHN